MVANSFLFLFGVVRRGNSGLQGSRLGHMIFDENADSDLEVEPGEYIDVKMRITVI